MRFLLVIWCNIFLLQPLVNSYVLCRLLCAFLNSCRLHTIGGTAVGSHQCLFVQNCTFAVKSRDCQSWQLQLSGCEFGDFDARHTIVARNRHFPCLYLQCLSLGNHGKGRDLLHAACNLKFSSSFRLESNLATMKAYKRHLHIEQVTLTSLSRFLKCHAL